MLMTASRETGPTSRVNKGLYRIYQYQIIRTRVNRVSAENMVVYYGCPMCGAVV